MTHRLSQTFTQTWLPHITYLHMWVVTRMHSSSMHTIHCQWSCLPCHACPCHACPSCHAYTYCHAWPPAMHAPLPCMPPCHACPLACTLTMHTPCHAWPPCHVCPLPCMPPCHTCPHHAYPLAMHAPCHACSRATYAPSPRGQKGMISRLCHICPIYLSAATVADGLLVVARCSLWPSSL